MGLHVATLMASSPLRRPRDEIGSTLTFSQAHDSLAVEARKQV